MVIAASSPLFKVRRPPDEPQERYLRDLQAAIDAAQSTGTNLAGQAILLVATER